MTDLQRAAARVLIREGWKSGDIAKALHLTRQQVAAVRAHLRMKTYDGAEPTPVEKRAAVERAFRVFDEGGAG